MPQAPTTLSEQALARALDTLGGWKDVGDGKAIVNNYTFATFAHAFAFMTRVALLAEKADHHPDWTNGYNRVSIQLATHDAGGVTEKDIQLARAIDTVVSESGK